MPLRKGG